MDLLGGSGEAPKKDEPVKLSVPEGLARHLLLGRASGSVAPPGAAPSTGSPLDLLRTRAAGGA